MSLVKINLSLKLKFFQLKLILQSYQNTLTNSNIQRNDDHGKIFYPLYY